LRGMPPAHWSSQKRRKWGSKRLRTGRRDPEWQFFFGLDSCSVRKTGAICLWQNVLCFPVQKKNKTRFIFGCRPWNQKHLPSIATHPCGAESPDLSEEGHC
jgi:hypothetical protein